MEEEVWYDFDGNDDCDESCRGWNGEDRRCDCGNRRVDWACLKNNCILEIKNCQECEHGYTEAW